jgi:hypothetical protein
MRPISNPLIIKTLDFLQDEGISHETTVKIVRHMDLFDQACTEVIKREVTEGYRKFAFTFFTIGAGAGVGLAITVMTIAQIWRHM